MANKSKKRKRNSEFSNIDIKSNRDKKKKGHKKRKKHRDDAKDAITSLHNNNNNNSNENTNFDAAIMNPNDFLRNEAPQKASFQRALETHYRSFVMEEHSPFLRDQQQHSKNINGNNCIETGDLDESIIQKALDTLVESNLLHADVTQPFGLGTKCAKTFVTRCLVGEPGWTYKYLGLRMFGYKWDNNIPHTTTTSDNAGKKVKPTTKLSAQQKLHQALHVMKRLNMALTDRTQFHLTKHHSTLGPHEPRGRAGFHVSLINCMDASIGKQQQESKRQNKNNNTAKCSVSWHADSSLEHYSTIGVYHTIVPQQDKKKHASSSRWSVALRVAPNAEGPRRGQQRVQQQQGHSNQISPPKIAVSMPSGSTYFMLHDFNHHHQHAVLSEGLNPGIRFSCTHRLLRESNHVDHLLERCRAVLFSNNNNNQVNNVTKSWKQVKIQQGLLTEMESEWIRQFFIQGQLHYTLLWHSFWKNPLLELLKYWTMLEETTWDTLQRLEAAAQVKCWRHNNNAAGGQYIGNRKIMRKKQKAFAAVQTMLQRLEEPSNKKKKPDKKNKNMTTTAHAALELIYQPLANLLRERSKMRQLWAEREADRVFMDVPSKHRPMPAPLVFESQQDDDDETTKKGQEGHSPLPSDLTAWSDRLEQLGRAMESGQMKDLPMESREAMTTSTTTATNNENTNETSTTQSVTTSKSLGNPPAGVSASLKNDDPSNERDDTQNKTDIFNWVGWSDQTKIFGLELQEPWAQYLLDGTKRIETRSYPLSPELIGRPIGILQSPRGRQGVSSLGNSIRVELNLTDNNNNNNKEEAVHFVGWCIFSRFVQYKTQQDFEASENDHLVTRDSGYGWKPGVTEVIYGWVVSQFARDLHPLFADLFARQNNSSCVAVRRMRSLFELMPDTTTNKAENNNKKGKAKKGKTGKIQKIS